MEGAFRVSTFERTGYWPLAQGRRVSPRPTTAPTLGSISHGSGGIAHDRRPTPTAIAYQPVEDAGAAGHGGLRPRSRRARHATVGLLQPRGLRAPHREARDVRVPARQGR
jgi:hypothetical protein